MLRSRLTPCLLINNGALVKSIRFKDYKYIGDPLNAVRIFNELFVDEIIILDISATKYNRGPDFELISDISSQCRMPLCYGGGIKDLGTIVKLIGLGVEKIALGSVLFTNPDLIKKASEILGSQSVVAVLDVEKSRFRKRSTCKYLNATKDSKLTPIQAANKFISMGAGEILLQSIDKDGTLTGFDEKLIESLFYKINCPLTVLGGAASYENIKKMAYNYGPIGISAGSLFVFQGIHKAVLINYPDRNEKITFTSLKE